MWLLFLAADVVYVQATTLNLRREPDGPLVSLLKIGDECTPLEVKNEWRKLNCGYNGGWTLSEFLGPTKPTASEQSKLARDTAQPLKTRFAAAKRAAALGQVDNELIVSLFFAHELETMRASRGGMRFKARPVKMRGTLLDTLAPQTKWVNSVTDGGDFVVAALIDEGTIRVRAGKLDAAQLSIDMEYQGAQEHELLRALWPTASEAELENPYGPIMQEGSGDYLENDCQPKRRAALRASVLASDATQREAAWALLDAMLCGVDAKATAIVKAALTDQVSSKSEQAGDKPTRSKAGLSPKDVMYHRHAYAVGISASGISITLHTSSQACSLSTEFYFDGRWKVTEANGACD